MHTALGSRWKFPLAHGHRHTRPSRCSGICCTRNSLQLKTAILSYTSQRLVVHLTYQGVSRTPNFTATINVPVQNQHKLTQYPKTNLLYNKLHVLQTHPRYSHKLGSISHWIDRGISTLFHLHHQSEPQILVENQCEATILTFGRRLLQGHCKP